MSTTTPQASLVRRLEDWFARIIGGFIGILLGLMVIIVFSNVIARYFLNSSLAWSEELSRFMLIWLAFLGSILAYIKNEHLGLDLLIFLPQRTAMIIRIVANLLALVALGVLLWGGWAITAHTMETGWTSPALSIPYGIVYLVVPFSAVMLLLQGVLKLTELVRAFVIEIKGEH
ncbi:MAG: TRAP transporter small permease [Desulfofustis sp.]|jgi:TRAP-type C4-dicarboxylate transport system permease small subunit|nr:TRAP transporter small permease [Desulfofustis sp.]